MSTNAPAPFTEDGWLITGDLGSVGVDGLVRITGRAKDLIIRSGHNIDPAVIEDAAASQPQVITSAAAPMRIALCQVFHSTTKSGSAIKRHVDE